MVKVNLHPARADYWKSQGRKFCDFCKCWIADNKPSIEFHEAGKKHKENVSKRLKEIHKASAKQAKQHRKFEDDLKKMETAAMAAYLKDVENNQKDIMAETIIRQKLENTEKSSTTTTVAKTSQLPPPETNPRYGNREFHPPANDRRNRSGNKGSGRNRANGREHPADVDPFDPLPQSRHFAETPSTNGHDDERNQGKSRTKGKDKKSKKGATDDGKTQKQPPAIAQQKLWYEAVSPEGYTYYWHVETNESVWEPPAEGFATIAEQEEEVKERELQEELHAQIEAEEAKKKEELAEEQRANCEREKLKEIRKLREEHERAQESSDSDEEANVAEERTIPTEMTVAPYRRDYSVPEKPQPYGSWKTVKTIDKKPVDLQLPKHKIAPVVVPPVQPQRPPRVFMEKTITKIETGDSDEETGPSTFKKRKFGKKNVRRRCDDD